MKKPWLEEGLAYFTNEKGQRCCSGSMMGRRNILPDSRKEVVKLRMERLRFVDQCYDQGGAYWGMPADLWCAYGEASDAQVQVFVRAPIRELAKNGVRRLIPNARFFR